MSIANELSRLLQAKSDLATSIANKGVTVPAATTIDGYAALVDQIQQGGGTLPYDAEVEYLESTGTQYIDTNISFTDNFTWEIKFSGGVKGTSIIGGRSSNTRTSCLFYDQTYNFTIPIAQSNATSTPFKLGDLSSGIKIVKAAIASNKGSVWIDGAQQYNTTSFSGSYISGVSCALFASKFGTNNYKELTKVKIYYFKMWQNGTLVGNFIPVKKDNVGYMYDKVSGELFGNAGTGSFTLGPDVT